MTQPPTVQHPSTTADPVTPTHTTTPQLSSASPDTPTKKDTPQQVQTPKMKGYSRIGVGVRPDKDPNPDPVVPVLSSGAAITDNMNEKNDGLGYGIELDQYDLRELEMDRGEGSSSSSTRAVILNSQPLESTSTLPEPDMPVTPPELESDVEIPDIAELKRMSERISTGSGEADKEELVGMVRTLLTPCLEQLPFLREQIEAQKGTIQTMQAHARLSRKLNEIERERHAAERTGWQREMKALIRTQEADIAAGKRPRKGLDLDVGYHQELEASNKRLEMDNRLMAPRLADTQKQIDKLVTELRHLRSSVILSTSAARLSTSSIPGPSELPQDEARRIPGSPSKTVFNTTTMGDARSEHLLLAARRVRTMRAQHPQIGMLTLDELKRHGVVGPAGGIGYSEGYGGVLEASSEDEESDEDEDRKPNIGVSPRKSIGNRGKKSHSVTNTPLLPRAKKSGKKNLPPMPTTPRGRNSQAAGPPPTTTPGGSNFNDLLRAAEMATRPHTPTRSQGTEVHAPMSAMSATRTRMREESGSERGSPVKKARTVPPSVPAGSAAALGFPDEDEDDEERDPSALDLLAQASQLEVAKGDTPEAEAEADADPGPEPSKVIAPPTSSSLSKLPSSSSTLEPAIDLHPSSTTPRATQPPLPSASSAEPTIQERGPLITPQSRPRNLSNASELETPAQRLMYPLESPSFDDGTPQGPHGHSRYGYGPATDPAHGFASPTGATVPGLGKYVHLSSSMPARRVRSPYLKWTVEEDELLARAVAIHGEKWDLVSKGVPTRSYHQVRQRWLRKTGAFDKKQPGTTTPADHHGSSGLTGYEDDREGSPTPQSGRAKKRKEMEQSQPQSQSQSQSET